MHWSVPVLVTGALLLPLVVEGTLCCYAQWCDALGKSTEVSTPILDTIAGGFQFCHEWCGDRIAPSFNSVLRDPKIAIPFSSLLIVMAIALLRRVVRHARCGRRSLRERG